MKKEGKIILGIDPGTNVTGYGLLRVEGKNPRCLALGCIEMGAKADVYEKLRRIFVGVTGIIQQYSPDEVAFESPFFGENVQSMLKLGRAQGVAMAAALVSGLEVFEYAPRRVKQSITGSGAASKQQVAAILKSILGHFEYAKLDATDGLAVALCHFYSSTGLPSSMRKSARRGSGRSWEAFLAANPQRELK